MRNLIVLSMMCCLMLASVAAPVAAAKTTVDCDHGDSLQAAIDASSPGDTILVSGRCTGYTTIDGGKRLTIRGVRNAVLDGTGSPTYALWVSFSSEVTLKRLTVTGGELGTIQSNRRLVLDKVTVAGNAGQGVVAGNAVTINRSVIEGNGGTGVAVSGSSARLTIANSVVRDNKAGGFPPGAGVYVGSGAQFHCSHSKIVDNHSANPGGGGVYVDAASSAVWDQCKVRRNSPNDCVGC